jgi:hypothetical protein
MSQVIFSDFGVDIIKRDNRFFVRYDAGEIASQMREEEISEDEVAKVRSGEQGAYEVLLECQKR